MQDSTTIAPAVSTTTYRATRPFVGYRPNDPPYEITPGELLHVLGPGPEPVCCEVQPEYGEGTTFLIEPERLGKNAEVEL